MLARAGVRPLLQVVGKLDDRELHFFEYLVSVPRDGKVGHDAEKAFLRSPGHGAVDANIGKRQRNHGSQQTNRHRTAQRTA